MEVLWFIGDPDGYAPWRPEGARTVDRAYCRQLAMAIDNLGFSGALVATGAHDVWVMTAALLNDTRNMSFLLAVHPGLISPVLLAKMSATFDQFSEGRLIINVVNGETKRLKGFGLEVGHDDRYALAEEYFDVWRRAVQAEAVDHEGRFFNIKGGKIDYPGRQKPTPPLWFSGSSDPALSLAARKMDAYLTWGEPPAAAGAKIDAVRKLAAKEGRTLRYGVRLNVIVRKTDEEAWEAADRLLDTMDAGAIANASRIFAASDSVGQARMRALHQGEKPKHARDLEIHPGLWAGIGLIRPGAGTALVGSPETVAALMAEYTNEGFDIFILSGIPLLEEAYRVSELLFPLLPLANKKQPEAKFTWGRDSMVAGAK